MSSSSLLVLSSISVFLSLLVSLTVVAVLSLLRLFAITSIVLHMDFYLSLSMPNVLFIGFYSLFCLFLLYFLFNYFIFYKITLTARSIPVGSISKAFLDITKLTKDIIFI